MVAKENINYQNSQHKLKLIRLLRGIYVISQVIVLKKKSICLCRIAIWRKTRRSPLEKSV